ncbi:MAG: hypothetical protein ACK4TA_20900 [Saprospiraceae bacterium]
MNNRIRSYKLEEIRKGQEYFETARQQRAQNGQLHDSYYSSFVGQFETIRTEFQDRIKVGELGFPRVEEEYLNDLLDNGYEGFMAKLIEKCTSSLTEELALAFEGKQLRVFHRVVEVYWSYYFNGTPNEYIYTIELHPHYFQWKVIDGYFANVREKGKLFLPLDQQTWHPS